MEKQKEIQRARQWLERYRLISQEVKRLKEIEKRLDIELHSLKSVNWGERLRGGEKRELADRLYKLERARDKLELCEKRKQKIRIQIMTCIANLENPNHREVLLKRYIDLKIYTEIAKEMEYSLQNIYKLHKDAIEQMTEVLRKNNLLKIKE